jgi:phosphate transport system substrate-binding protein
MKTKNILILSIIVLIFASCSSKARKEQTINISGAFAIYPLVVKWTEEYSKLNPDVRFNVSGGGAGKGLADALSGAVDLGMFSREITQIEKDKGTWWVGLTIDAVVPTINSQNPYLEQIKQKGLTKSEFEKVFVTEEITNWGVLLNLEQGEDIVLHTRSDACGAAETWAKYMGKKQEDLKGIGVFGDPGLAEVISKTPFGIGYNNTIFAYDTKTGRKRNGIELIPIDINENGKIDTDEYFYDTFDEILDAIAQGKYPSPPARELYFVSNGKPSKEPVINFMAWCLTEGQKYVKEAGYVPLDNNSINEYLEKLK